MTEEFEKTYPGVMDKIWEHVFDNKNHGFKIIEHRYKDAINSEGLISFKNQDKTILVHFENGNVNGSQIIDFGEDITLPKEKRPVYSVEYKDFVKYGRTEEELRLMYKKLEAMNITIQDKLKNRAYDLKFCPTDTIHKHYKDWFDNLGLDVVTEWVDA